MRRLLAALVFLPASVWAQTQTVAPASASATPVTSQKFGSPCTYPASAWRAHAVGETVLTFRVVDDGRIADVKVIYSSGNTDLDVAATQCVSQWHADPHVTGQAGPIRGIIAWTIPIATQDGVASAPVGRFRRAPAASCGTQYYPPAAIRSGAEGTAVVSVHIDEKGAVSGVDLLQSTGNKDLDDATISCVTKSWHFRPATQSGKPIASSMRYAIRWALHPDMPAPETPASVH